MSGIKAALAKGVLSASVLVLGMQAVWSWFGSYGAQSIWPVVGAVLRPGYVFKSWVVRTFDLPGNDTCLVIVEWWHRPVIVLASLLAWAAGLGLLALALQASRRNEAVA